MNYFTEPYKKYDGVWKGTHYYEMMADRKRDFKYIIVFTLIVSVFVLSAFLMASGTKIV